MLESLNRKGLVDVIPDTPQRFRANPVSALYDTRVEELRAEEAELKRVVGELLVQFAPTAARPAEAADADFIHVAHGRTHFATLARRLVAEAKQSITVVGDRLLLARLALNTDLARALALAATRIPVRILVPQNAVDHVEGRAIRLDELADRIRRAPLRLADATLFVRDREEYLVTRFIPNDLHASRGSDRVEVGRDAEIASVWDELATNAWEKTPPAAARR